MQSGGLQALGGGASPSEEGLFAGVAFDAEVPFSKSTENTLVPNGSVHCGGGENRVSHDTGALFFPSLSMSTPIHVDLRLVRKLPLWNLRGGPYHASLTFQLLIG